MTFIQEYPNLYRNLLKEKHYRVYQLSEGCYTNKTGIYLRSVVISSKNQTPFIMRIIIVLLIILSLTGCRNDSTKKDIISQQDKDIIYQHVKDFPVGTRFSIAIIKNNEAGFLGYQIAENKFLEIDNRDSVFEIGSVTKVFTSAILANLVKENILQLDDTIAGILPFRLNSDEENAQNLTFITLANHTSGLPAYPSNLNRVAEKNPLNPYSEYDTLLLRTYLEKELDLLSTPEESYAYSDLGYSLLGYLLELKTGEEFEQLLQKYITRKYNMIHTTSVRSNVQNWLVKGINEKGEEMPNMDFNIFMGAGSILSSANDLAGFISANFTSDSALYLQRQLTFSDHSHNVSLGWHMIWICGYTPFYWYFHNGGTLGYRSTILMDTKAKSAVIILSNITTYYPLSHNIDQLARELLRNQYKLGEIDYDSYCEAPFIESAIEKGWGTKINDSISRIQDPEYPIVGVWQKPIPNRVILRTFTPDFKTQTDFYGDEEIDVWGYYELRGDTIVFKDMGGVPCDFAGIYKYDIVNDTLRFRLIKDDECDGRVREMGDTWTRVITD